MEFFKLKRGKGAQMLVENVVFIVLNLVFLSILVLFLVKQGSSVSMVEEPYAKKIALLIDSAKPGMMMKINMEDVVLAAEDGKINLDDAIRINGQYVVVDLGEGDGYSYHFFNKIDVKGYFDTDENNEYNGYYILNFNKIKEVANE